MAIGRIQNVRSSFYSSHQTSQTVSSHSHVRARAAKRRHHTAALRHLQAFRVLLGDYHAVGGQRSSIDAQKIQSRVTLVYRGQAPCKYPSSGRHGKLENEAKGIRRQDAACRRVATGSPEGGAKTRDRRWTKQIMSWTLQAACCSHVI